MISYQRALNAHSMAVAARNRAKTKFTRCHALAVQFRALEIMFADDPERAAMSRESAEFWQSEARRVRGAA
jgi:hypothetical protein